MPDRHPAPIIGQWCVCLQTGPSRSPSRARLFAGFAVVSTGGEKQRGEWDGGMVGCNAAKIRLSIHIPMIARVCLHP